MRNTILALLLCTLLATCAAAQPSRHDLQRNPLLCAANHVAYPWNDANLPRLTPPPAGYEPFYIDHYGRHGSRWLSTAADYTDPIEPLAKAERKGLLTARGRQLLAQLRAVQQASHRRTGELSDVGAEQHQAIARRMYERFPQVFAGQVTVEARSSVVIRCILSMLNETSTLAALNPDISFVTDASEHDMHITAWKNADNPRSNALRRSMDKVSERYQQAVASSRFVNALVSDTAYAADSIDARRLMRDVFDVAGSLQNHHAFDPMSLLDYFTPDERYQLWRAANIYWYTHSANAVANGGRMPYVERDLLAHMVATADSVITCHGHGATLRFGHETCLLPLACMLEIDNANYSTACLDSLDYNWQCYNYFPMGCNIQLVFYRPGKKGTGNKPGDVLVKVLLNEQEARLPFKTRTWPYYRWSDLRDYYYRKAHTPIDWTIAAPHP